MYEKIDKWWEELAVWANSRLINLLKSLEKIYKTYWVLKILGCRFFPTRAEALISRGNMEKKLFWERDGSGWIDSESKSFSFFSLFSSLYVALITHFFRIFPQEQPSHSFLPGRFAVVRARIAVSPRLDQGCEATRRTHVREFLPAFL